MITINLLYTILMGALYGIMYIAVPAFILYPYVKKHELGFRILFYQISALTYVSLMSFVLCYLKIYYVYTSWLVFFILPVGLRVYCIRKKIAETYRAQKDAFLLRQKLQEGFRMRRRRIATAVKAALGTFFKKIFFPNFLLLLTIGVFIFVIAKDLGYFHLHYYSYACSDEPTHIYWVSNILTNTAFPAGLYPHGMHFMIAVLCSMFGLTVTRAWLAFGIVSVTVIILSTYLTCIKIFSNRLAGIFGVGVFLCSGIFLVGEWYQRLEMVMPMEFAMFAYFVMLYGLIAWARDQKLTSLLMVGMGILGTTLIHVFVTIFAFFTVVAFFVVYHGVMQRNKGLHKLILCGVVSIVVAVLPYAVGLAIGYNLEQSFNWGMSNVNTGTETSSHIQVDVVLPEVGVSPITEPEEEEVEYSMKEQLEAAETKEDYIAVANQIMPEYLTSDATGGYILLGCAAFLLLWGALGVLICRKKEEAAENARVLLFVAAAWFLEFICLYLGYIFDVFSLVVPGRCSGFIALLSVPVLAAPLVVVYKLFRLIRLNLRVTDWILSFAALFALVAYSVSGLGVTYHDFVYGFCMEDLDIQAEEYIKRTEKDDTWTFISTTNARMGVFLNGYHYEITDLLRCVRDTEELYIPTPTIYVMVEKIVPSVTSLPVDGSTEDQVVYPVSAEFANTLLSDVMPIYNGTVDSKVYLTDYNRCVIMSHLYYWMEKMKIVYPDEISVLMEDDYCTIYKISQDEYFLLDLVIDYSDLVQQDLAKEQV